MLMHADTHAQSAVQQEVRQRDAGLNIGGCGTGKETRERRVRAHTQSRGQKTYPVEGTAIAQEDKGNTVNT